MTLKQFLKTTNWITMNGAHIPIKTDEYGSVKPPGYEHMSDSELKEHGDFKRCPTCHVPYDASHMGQHMQDAHNKKS